MKIRACMTTILVLLSMQGSLRAGDRLSAGLFNSYKGFGISLDYAANEDILNSYIIYADTYRMFDGTYGDAGLKLVYIHYNRLSSFSSERASFDLLLGPGASTGYARDWGTDRLGFIFTADVAVAFKVRIIRNIDLELGAFAELGFVTGNNGSQFLLSMYDNGLRQAFIPFLKIMKRF